MVHRGIVALYQASTGKAIARLSAGESHELLAPRVAEGSASETPLADEKAPSSSSPRRASLNAKPERAQTASAARGATMPHSPMTSLAGLGSSEPVNVLLREADDARKHQKPIQAAALLARILKEFPDDPVVGLVALTLGRIRLDTLHQPRAAAAAFKQAVSSKGLPAPLMEQAYARCVEAFHRAGESASARSMSHIYKSRFPGGVWLSWVERWADAE